MSVLMGSLIIILGTLVIRMGLAYLRFRTTYEKEYGEATEAFFESARPLISDDEIPTEIIEIIDALNAGITNRNSATRILGHIVQNRSWEDKCSPPPEKAKILNEFFQRRPELEKPFYKMLVHWFKAVTALSPFVGLAARFMLSENGLEKVAIGMSKKANGHNNNLIVPPDTRVAIR